MELNDVLFEITKDNILKFTTPLEIFKVYLDKPVFNRAFNSPFRKDNNPSFIIKSEKAYWKDFATGEFGDCFAFVKKLYGINFNEALIQIVHDLGIKEHFNIPNVYGKIIRKKQAKVNNTAQAKTYTGEFKLTIKQRKWRQADWDYWDSYGVKHSIAKWANIVPISHYFINGIPFVADIYAYAYIENKDGIISYKVYQPFSPYKKWINNNDYSVWELWKGTTNIVGNSWARKQGVKANEVLVITSSRKDAAAIIGTLGLNSTALQAETITPKPKVMMDLLSQYPYAFLLLDNDIKGASNWGQLAAKKLMSLYSSFLTNIIIPDVYKSKDYSDLYFNHGEVIAKEVMKKLTKL